MRDEKWVEKWVLMLMLPAFALLAGFFVYQRFMHPCLEWVEDPNRQHCVSWDDGMTMTCEPAKRCVRRR